MQVGDWSVLHDLGRGNCCRVLSVKNRQTGVLAALKVFDLREMVIRDATVRSLEEARVSVKEEAERLCLLQQHQHIITIYSVSHSRQYSYVFMELAAGGELFDYLLSRGRLTEAEARTLFRQLVSAVEYCHAHFIVHRDLKLENVLLTADDGSIRLIDFGMSCRVRPGELLYRRCGSPDYVAPEILRNSGYTGPPSDLWSMGVMLYTLLHGHLPFGGKQRPPVQERLNAIKRGDFVVSNDSLSLECKDLLYSLLTLDPRERLTLPLLRHHLWLNKGHDTPPLCALPKYAPTEQIDPHRVSQLCYFDFDPIQLVQDVRSGSLCQAVAMYHLLSLHNSRTHSSV